MIDLKNETSKTFKFFRNMDGKNKKGKVFIKLLKNIWKVIKPCVPRKVLPIVVFFYRIYMRILCWYVNLWDQRNVKQTGFHSLPPAFLRYRVHASPYIDDFLEVGKKCSQDIEVALRKIGKDFNSFQHILDFGCGCGCTLIWFANHSPLLHFYGTDIDAKAISWCRSNLNFAMFSVNKPLPALEYSSEMFDLIYVISVFTHFNEDYQFRWLSELKRIAKPKGILLLTVHGEYCWKNLCYEDVTKIKKYGFLFIISNTMRGIFPEWYQTAYHTKEYIFDKYGKYFNIVDYIPRGLNNHQDMIILQKDLGIKVVK